MAVEVDGLSHEKPGQQANDDIARDIFYLYGRLDQKRPRPDFDIYDLKRINLTDALKADNDYIINKIFK